MKLKPVIINGTRREHHRQDDSRQKMLLKALSVTSDPKKLKDMIGVRRVADVFRTLDKMSIRKEYHEALYNAGIDFDFIVSGIKNVCTKSLRPETRLKGYQVLLKSLGMDKYEDKTEGSGGGWEDIVKKSIEAEVIEEDDSINEEKDYEVDLPEMPKSAKKKREDEESIIGNLYEKRNE